MSEPAKRFTIYFEPEVHRALRLKAASTHRSVSDLVNEAVRHALQNDELEILNLHAEELNREAEDVLDYQVIP